VAALDVEREGIVVGPPERPLRGRHGHGDARGHARGQRQAEGHAGRLRDVHEFLAAQVLVEQGHAEEVERLVLVRGVFQQVQGGFQRVQQVGLDRGRIRKLQHPALPMRRQARVEPRVRLRFDGRQAHGVRRAARPQRTLRIAGDPVFREPAHVAGQPQGRHQVVALGHAQVLAQALFQAGQQLQGVIARIHQRERQLLAAGAAHVGGVDGGGHCRHGGVGPSGG
jgi:hypothetical protein